MHATRIVTTAASLLGALILSSACSSEDPASSGGGTGTGGTNSDAAVQPDAESGGSAGQGGTGGNGGTGGTNATGGTGGGTSTGGTGGEQDASPPDADVPDVMEDATEEPVPESIYAEICSESSMVCNNGLTCKAFSLGAPGYDGYACTETCSSIDDCDTTGAVDAPIGCLPFTSGTSYCLTVCLYNGVDYPCPDGLSCIVPGGSALGWCMKY
jgi:hypothetical protein